MCRGFFLHVITLNDAHKIGGAPLDEGSASSKNLYLTKHDTHKRQTSIPPVKFEPVTPTSQLLQTHRRDGAATSTGNVFSNLDLKADFCNVM